MNGEQALELAFLVAEKLKASGWRGWKRPSRPLAAERPP